MKSVQFGIGLLVGCAALSAAGGAIAQTAGVQATATTSKTTTTTTTTAPVLAPAPADAPPAPVQTSTVVPGAMPDPVTAATDHAGVVGHFGIGYLGRRTILIDPDAAPNTVDAPVIGVRYWLSPLLGIDAGLGLLLQGGSNRVGGVSTDQQGFTVFMLHGGVPLALAGSRHFSFQVIPELNLGLSSSQRGPGGADLSGFHLDVGARAGAEIQFGFIGIPELSLQAGLGLALRYDRVKASGVGAVPEHTVSTTSLGTSVGDNPWNIFTGNVAALYYFD